MGEGQQVIVEAANLAFVFELTPLLKIVFAWVDPFACVHGFVRVDPIVSGSRPSILVCSLSLTLLIPKEMIDHFV